MRGSLIVLTLIVVTVGGCAGDERLSREDYVREADAICRKYEQELEAVERDVEGAGSPQALGAAIERGIPIVRRGQDELRELEPPDEIEDEVERWLDLNDENVENLERLQEAAEANDARELQRIAQEGSETEERSDEVAREIGLEDCARNG